jgi:hypothetical protein
MSTTTTLTRIKKAITRCPVSGDSSVSLPGSSLTEPLHPGYGFADFVASRTPGKVAGEERAVLAQPLTLILDGITAEDYLSRVRDPEPPALGRDLRCLLVRAEPLGDRIDVELIWDREPPAPRAAAVAAGFLLTPEILDVRGRPTAHGEAFAPQRLPATPTTGPELATNQAKHAAVC